MKGFFTQGALVLTDGPLAIDAVNRALAKFKVAKFTPAEAHPGWMGGQPTWLVAYRPEVNGYVLVESFGVPWPDHMGDPKGAGGTQDPMGEVMLFGAWSMGIMGPHTFPGNFARAVNAAQRTGRRPVADAAERHRGFVRIKSSYILGAEDSAKVAPEDYDVRAELEFVTDVARAIAHAPGALCYFNSAGETLFLAKDLDAAITSCAQDGLPALPVWSNHRVARLDTSPGWGVGDVVGMEQLDASDHEAVFQQDRFDVNEVLLFLRNASMYTLDHGPVIETGHTTDGPGGLWRAVLVEESILPAPRPIIRWYADSGPRPPSKYIANAGNAPTSAGSKPPQPPVRGGIASRLKRLFGR
jgi:hypothetical protein